MDSKKPNPFGELLKKLVFEDAEAETENETEEILHTGTEAEFEFGAENEENTPDISEPESSTFSDSQTADEGAHVEEVVPDFLKEFEEESEKLAKTDMFSVSAEDTVSPSEDPVNEEKEDITEEDAGEISIIPDVPDNEEPESTDDPSDAEESADTSDRTESESGAEKTDDGPEDEKKPILFSGPVSDDTAPSSFRGADEDIYRSKRQSFSYISTAKNEDRSGPAIRNPEDNIRYVRKESRKLKKEAEEEITPKKKASFRSERNKVGLRSA
ncbi:hypothetical protein [Ruminococcus sp. HUN007]|uniref:hypothetical protein n=1 Tax=Ruminococcus sp. HUN007 TaxID=1514668 RepID=UPI0005D1EE66|nr:hypothetical protein [Ruminococcus sp. HUN007]